MKLEDVTQTQKSVALFHRKSNLGPLLPAVGFEVTFSPNRIEFRRTNVAALGDLAANLRERMKQTVRHKPLTIAKPR